MVLSVVVFADEADGAGLVKRAISTAGRWLHSDLPVKTVFTNASNTYDDGKVQTFTDDDLRIQDNTGGQFYTFSTGDLVADRSISLPVLGATDVFVFEAASQTLTSKSVDADSNTITNIDNNEIKASAGIDKSKISSSGAWTAAEIPSLDTSKITTGTMATARLGSGTANATTFLRGDQTYVWLLNPTFLTSDITCTATGSYCTVFSIPLTVSRSNIIRVNLMVDTNTGGAALQFRGKASDAQATGTCTFIEPSAAAATVIDNIAVGTAPVDDSNTTWFAGANISQFEEIWCTVEADATGGQTLDIEYQMEVSATGTIHKGSYYTIYP